MNRRNRRLRTLSAFVLVALLATMVPLHMAAQDDDDPPSRAARLGHMEGSVSFQPAGESEWVEAVPNRPMTTGDKLWADRDARAEVELGSTSIRLTRNTGFSFLNLDDRTVQIQLSSGAINLRVRRLDHDDVFEVDTPNQAFSIFQPGQYRIEASEDGNYTVITVRQGEGESTGNGQTYRVHTGLRATFSGTDRLNADFSQIADPDDFDNWCDRRDHRFDDSPSSRYVSRDVVGAEDLDEYGDWRPSPEYGNVWYPRVDAGWAPYHTGHWAWIDPWGWTWVDEAPWGYAPFHYGRWAFVGARWGWIPGPIEVRPVYAPALVVFVGGRGPGFGGNVGWFPLGPREVYVPAYHVSPAYVNRVNISNTTVNQTTITNVYNTTIINKTTVNNVTYVNRSVTGAVTAVPQNAFAGGQSVSRVAVRVNQQQLATATVSDRVAVAPARTAVLGVHADTANRVAAPPAAVLNRPVIAKVAPPPPPVSFAAKQQALTANPGQPVARQEMQRLRPANAPTSQPLVRQAPPGRPATPDMGRPGNAPGNPPPGQPGNPAANQPGNRPGNPPMNQPRPGQPPMNQQPPANQPANRPFAPPPSRNDRPPAAQPNEPQPNQPGNGRPTMQPNDRPGSDRPGNDRPMNDRLGANAPENRPQPNAPTEADRPAQRPPSNDRPASTPPPVNRPAPSPRPQPQPPAERPQPNTPPPAAHPAPQHPPAPAKPQPDDKKKQDDKKSK